MAIPCLNEPAYYGRFGVWFLNPGGSYPLVYTVNLKIPSELIKVRKDSFCQTQFGPNEYEPTSRRKFPP